ncbi:MAG: hypothetical protein WCH83_14125 [Alphaproteobacteria bacterium]
METAGVQFFYLCAAIVVPILLARFVIRADWRTVRNASLVWYGVLFLPFAVTANEEWLGWGLIIALFSSFWGIPLLSLILKLWGPLSAKFGLAAAGTAPRPYWGRVWLAVMSAAALWVLGIHAFNFWRAQRDLDASVHFLRQMFAVPEEAVVREARRLGKVTLEIPRGEAIVQLTPVQFESFRARMEADRAWPGAGARIGGAPLGVTSPETIRWRALPATFKVDGHSNRWSRLTAEPVEGIRNGRFMCLFLSELERDRRAEHANKDAPRYAARDCADVAPEVRGGREALAALDFDSRTLYMIIQ